MSARRQPPVARPSPPRHPPSDDPPAPSLVRLNKYLADNGVASRRRADAMIAAGEVMVDGEIVTAVGTKVDPNRQRVEVDGVLLRPEGERHRYFLLNKPAGVMCTNEGREARRRAVDLITDRRKGRIYTVGRLDEDTTGLVILTNDGELAYRISHPRFGVPKTYKVLVRGRVGNEDIERMRRGVRLSDMRVAFDTIRVSRRTDRGSTVLVTLQEGRHREIRRVFAHLKLAVKGLHRVRIGPLTDRGLKVGSWRPLTREEVAELAAFAARAPGRSSRRPGDRRPSGRRP
ncbi:MAG: pseudouridine synthase [Planctomycetota bacterium]